MKDYKHLLRNGVHHLKNDSNIQHLSVNTIQTLITIQSLILFGVLRPLLADLRIVQLNPRIGLFQPLRHQTIQIRMLRQYVPRDFSKEVAIVKLPVLQIPIPALFLDSLALLLRQTGLCSLLLQALQRIFLC